MSKFLGGEPPPLKKNKNWNIRIVWNGENFDQKIPIFWAPYDEVDDDDDVDDEDDNVDDDDDGRGGDLGFLRAQTHKRGPPLACARIFSHF